MKTFFALAWLGLALIWTASPSFSEEEHEEAHSEHLSVSGSVGEGKAVLEASEEKGFKLSPNAFETLQIKTLKAPEGPPYLLPLQSLVYFQDRQGLYCLRDGFFKRIEAGDVKKIGDQVWIQAPDLRPDDAVAQTGVGFLRVTELEVFGGIKTSHGH